MLEEILPPFETPSLAHPMRCNAEAAFGFGKFQRIAHQEKGPIGECRATVAREVMRHGGCAVLGWQIHIWPHLFFEALAHFVWQAPSGALVDLSTKYPTDKATYSLFIPSRAMRSGDSLHSRYYILNHAPEVHVLIDASRRQDENRRRVEESVRRRLGRRSAGRLLDHADENEKSILEDDERWVGVAIRACQMFAERDLKPNDRAVG